MIVVLATLAVALSTASGSSTAPPSTAPPTTASASTPAAETPTSTAEAPTSTTALTETPLPEGYVRLVDDTGAIIIAVPEAWIDIDTAPVVGEDGSTRPRVAASPDIDSFLATFDTPGVAFTAVPYTADALTVAAQYALAGGCDSLEVKSYDDPVFVGVVQVGTNCGPHDMTWNLVVASPADETFTAVVQAQTADPNELRTLLLTFNESEASSASSTTTVAASTTIVASSSTTTTTPG